jgi:hypothetical protein
MKHIRKFNELKSDTYYSAADGLGSTRHPKRYNDLMKKGAEVREIEIAKDEETRKDKKFKKWQSLIDKYSRFGKFKFRIKRGRNIEEDYHIMIIFDRDKF